MLNLARDTDAVSRAHGKKSTATRVKADEEIERRLKEFDQKHSKPA